MFFHQVRKNARREHTPAKHKKAPSKEDGRVAEKVEVQETLSPAGVLGAEPLSLMPQHIPREPAKRRFQTMAANQGFPTVSPLEGGADLSADAGGVPQERSNCHSWATPGLVKVGFTSLWLKSSGVVSPLKTKTVSIPAFTPQAMSV